MRYILSAILVFATITNLSAQKTLSLKECLEVGLSTISKAAMNRGMSDLIFICYSNALAIFFLLPSSLFFYTKIRPSPPPLTWPIIFRILILGEIR